MQETNSNTETSTTGGHTLHKCNDDNCKACRGGLAWCIICGGAEGSLPTECPGEMMDMEKESLVMAGIMDYVGGEWIYK